MKAFLAYPAEPVGLRDTIERAVAIAPKAQIDIRPWPQLEIFGGFIPDEVRAAIDEADVGFFDITIPNQNVYYELGYAVGRNKPVGPILNSGFAGAVNNIRQQGLFDNLGYRDYTNSRQLKKVFTSQLRHNLLSSYRRDINRNQPLFLLDTQVKSDFRNAIVSAIKNAKVFFRSFDPVETARVSAIQLISDLSSSTGIIIPFIEDYLVDYERHNLRAAFIAGFAHGLDLQALLIRLQTHGGYSAADFRDLIVYVGTPDAVENHVVSFAQSSLTVLQDQTESAVNSNGVLLRGVSLGAVAAENEFRTLRNYFVETSEYIRTLRGEVRVVTGRKGSGKTAIFFQVRDTLRVQDGTLVIDLKPESFQMSKFRDDLAELVDAGLVDHTLSAFWYFVMLSEVMVALRKRAERYARADSRAASLISESADLIQSFGIPESGDFNLRLNQLVRYFLDELRGSRNRGAPLAIEEITNLVFRSAVPELREFILKHTLINDKIVLLFDNIDKGWPSTGVEDVDIDLIRTLLESLTKLGQDLASYNRKFESTVFLRNDIFELLIDDTPDRGKFGRVNIDWSDREKLRQLIARRLKDSHGLKSADFSSIWNSLFDEKVDGRDSFEFLVDHSLMRPRFLISLVEIAIGNAINRQHSKVSDVDCVESVNQYSHSLIDDFGFEIRDVSKFPSDMLYYFVGSEREISAEEIIKILKEIGMTVEESSDALHLMLWYGVIGLASVRGNPLYIFDVGYNMKRLMSETQQPSFDSMYVINPGIYPALA